MKVTDEMVMDARQELERHNFPFDTPPERYMRAALERALKRIELDRWDAFSDEDLVEINAGASERAEKLSLPEDVRRRAEGIYNETSLENQRRKGGYQGPGVYEVASVHEIEVLGRHVDGGGIVMRNVGDVSGRLFFETWNKFNSPASDGTIAYRYLRPLDSEKSAP